MSGPLIHIGYHRTGTTWLQRGLFQDRELGFQSAFSGQIAKALVYPNALDFDAKTASQVFEVGIREAQEQGRIPVVSAERLSGNPLSGGYDSKELAERIAQVFPTGKILIVIREQRQMILSTFKRYIRAGGPCSLGNFMEPPGRGRGRVPLFDLDHFRYHRLIEHYTNLFDRSAVCVLPYEQLRADPLVFLAAIADFAGAPNGSDRLAQLQEGRARNVGLSGLGLALKRGLNPIAARSRINPGALFDAPAVDRVFLRTAHALDRLTGPGVRRRYEDRLRRAIDAQVGDYYQESNRATAALTGLDLEEYGYPV